MVTEPKAELRSTLDGKGYILLVSCGAMTALPIPLPGLVLPGQVDVRVLDGHCELKIPTPPAPSRVEEAPLSPALLDASQLQVATPTSFICASCSLPLVQATQIQQYRDLPSEHWEELVDAWMCHSDQTLHDQVGKHSRGFWPSVGQALVGGSYILFEDSSVSKGNLLVAKLPQVSIFLQEFCVRAIKKTSVGFSPAAVFLGGSAPLVLSKPLRVSSVNGRIAAFSSG